MPVLKTPSPIQLIVKAISPDNGANVEIHLYKDGSTLLYSNCAENDLHNALSSLQVEIVDACEALLGTIATPTPPLLH